MELKFHIPDKVLAEVDCEFIQGMINRMIVSFYKYGAVRDAYPEKVDAIKSLEKRLSNYKESGNKEWLMDAANFAMIEFMAPRHKNAHFRATESDESPGRKFIKEKGFTTKSNTGERESEESARAIYKKQGD